MANQPNSGGGLFERASRAALWNTLFLPLLTGSSILFSVLIRRRFELFSGVYDVVIGLGGAVQQYSSLGIPGSLPKFLPEINNAHGSVVLRRFLREVVALRLVLVAVLLIPLNIFADSIARELGLGEAGSTYIRLLSGLVVVQAVMNLMVATLNAFFAQFWTNLFGLLNSLLRLGTVGIAVGLGYGMGGVLGALVASVTIVTVMSAVFVSSKLEGLSDADPTLESRPSTASSPWLAGEAPRFLRFNILIYLSSLLGFFTTMGFVAPGLALVQSTDEVALFAVAFNLSFTTMNVAITGFRGLYAPVVSRIRLRNDQTQLRRVFTIVTKGQLVVLIPAGVGLIVMSGDYIPLLFGDAFRPSVPIAWILIGFMYATTSLNLPSVILRVDERYRAVFVTQAIPLLTAALFLFTTSAAGLVPGAAVFGAGRLLTAVVAYLFCRQMFGIRYPWLFASRVAVVSLAMGLVVGWVRTMWSTSVMEVITLTVLGIVVYGIGIRVARLLGPDELDLVKRSGLPGHERVIALLSPRPPRP